MRSIRCSDRLSCHTCPLPCTPSTMHAPCHAHPLCHTCPPLPLTPPTMHAPLPCTSPHHTCPPPPMNRITDRCKNITFPQLLLQTVITLQERNCVGYWFGKITFLSDNEYFKGSLTFLPRILRFAEFIADSQNYTMTPSNFQIQIYYTLIESIRLVYCGGFSLQKVSTYFRLYHITSTVQVGNG